MKLHKIAAALAFTALAVGSQAAPLISSFGTNTTGGFIGGSATCDGGGSISCSLAYTGAVQTGLVPNIALDPTVPPFLVAAFTPGLTTPPLTGVVGLPTFNRVSWGTSTGAGQSYLDVAHIMNGLTTVTTNGAWETIDRFSHQNNVLTQAGGFMNFVAIFAEVSLLAQPGFGGLGVPGLSPISFLETFNAASELLCSPTPNPTGSPLPCDDVFSTTPLEATFQFFTDAGGTPYFISFRFVNETAVVLPGGLGVLAYTAENVLSSTITQLRVFTVPEPTMLGLFGLALVGVALSRRRKQAA